MSGQVGESISLYWMSAKKAVAAVSKRLVWEYPIGGHSFPAQTRPWGETKGPNLIRASGIMCTYCFNWWYRSLLSYPYGICNRHFI